MKLALASTITAITLTGCSSGTLPCNNGDIKNTVLDIITTEVRKARYAIESEESNRLNNYSIEGIKTLSHNEKTDFYSCSGKFSFEFDEKSTNKEFTYELSYLEDIDDTEVVVYGISGVKARVLAKVMAGNLISK